MVDGRLGFFDEPVYRLAGAVIAKTVLDIVELDGGVRRKTHTAVPGAFGGADFAVAVFSASGADNVAALDLDNLAAAAATTASHCCS